MRHPIVEAVLASPNVRDFVMPRLVEECFGHILSSRYATEVEPRRAFVTKVVAFALESDEPMAAFARMRRANPTVDGAVFDALVAVYLRFDRHVSALLSSCAVAERWKGPVDVPCIVAVGYGEAPPVLHLAVPTIGLEPYALAVVALLEYGVPRRAVSGAIEWFTLPWHRIQAVVGTELSFDPEGSAGQSYVAGLLAKPPAPLQSIDQLGVLSSSLILEAAFMSEFFDAIMLDEGDGAARQSASRAATATSGPEDLRTRTRTDPSRTADILPTDFGLELDDPFGPPFPRSSEIMGRFLGAMDCPRPGCRLRQLLPPLTQPPSRARRPGAPPGAGCIRLRVAAKVGSRLSPNCGG